MEFRFFERLDKSCSKLAHHIGSQSKHGGPELGVPESMVVFCKIDNKSRLWILWMDSLRFKDDTDVLSTVHSMIDKARSRPWAAGVSSSNGGVKSNLTTKSTSGAKNASGVAGAASSSFLSLTYPSTSNMDGLLIPGNSTGLTPQAHARRWVAKLLPPSQEEHENMLRALLQRRLGSLEQPPGMPFQSSTTTPVPVRPSSSEEASQDISRAPPPPHTSWSPAHSPSSLDQGAVSGSEKWESDFGVGESLLYKSSLPKLVTEERNPAYRRDDSSDDNDIESNIYETHSKKRAPESVVTAINSSVAPQQKRQVSEETSGKTSKEHSIEIQSHKYQHHHRHVPRPGPTNTDPFFRPPTKLPPYTLHLQDDDFEVSMRSLSPIHVSDSSRTTGSRRPMSARLHQQRTFHRSIPSLVVARALDPCV